MSGVTFVFVVSVGRKKSDAISASSSPDAVVSGNGIISEDSQAVVSGNGLAGLDLGLKTIELGR